MYRAVQSVDKLSLNLYSPFHFPLQVFGINFEQPKEKNPDDLADEEAGEDLAEDDAISLSKHTEENEDSVILEDEDEEEGQEEGLEEASAELARLQEELKVKEELIERLQKARKHQ